MDVFERFGEAVKQKSKIAADKAKEMAGVAQLKMSVSTQEDLIKKNYQEIGKLYCELYSDMPEEPFRKYCEAIKTAQKEIEALQEQIDLLKK